MYKITPRFDSSYSCLILIKLRFRRCSTGYSVILFQYTNYFHIWTKRRGKLQSPSGKRVTPDIKVLNTRLQMDTITHEENNLCITLEQGIHGSHDIFQINRETFSACNYIVIQNPNPEQQLKLVCSGLSDDLKSIDLLEAFNSGLFELLERPAEDEISIASLEPSRVYSKNVSSNSEQRIAIITDSTRDEWKSVLKPGNTYHLQFSKNKGELWGYYNDESQGRAPTEIPHSERLGISRGSASIQFTVYDDPATPKLFMDVVGCPRVISRSGRHVSSFFIIISSDATEPITIDKSGTPFSSWPSDFHSLSELVYCEDAETGEPVQWKSAHDPELDSFLSDLESFPYTLPPESEFEEILSYQAFRYECFLGNWGGESFDGSGSLQAGRTYKVKAPENITWRFERWMWGRKRDVLKGDEVEQKDRWDTSFEGGRGTGLKVYPGKRGATFEVSNA